MAVDPAIIRQYREEGAVCIRNVFSERWVESLKEGVANSLQSPSLNARHYNAEHGVGLYLTDAAVWRDIPQYREFVLDSGAGAIAAQLMGSRKVNIFCDDMFFKDANTPQPTPWHHDMPYFPVEGDQVCSIWLALDELPKEDSVEYIAGSHRWGKQFRPRSFFDPNQKDHEGCFPSAVLEPMPDFERQRAELPLRSWAMSPGDVQVFHGYTVHGAAGNSTNHCRRAFITRWCGDDVVYAWKGESTYPRFPDCTLKPGDPLDGETFPVVFRA